ncbi:MAG: signal peptidase Serine peptidase [Bryobacterales bacterium]|nr:signal peptidase Serine peptidase [Bryobacterales bacterium]
MSRKHPKKSSRSAPAPSTPKSKATGGSISRGIAEWTFNFIILVFATGMIAQPFVIPTSSMEDNLLVGDHLIVDRLAYAPAGPVSRHLLPYEPVKRGDIIVFRYPLKIEEDYVKRAIGIPGDRIRIVNKQVFLNGKKLDEPYKVHKTSDIDSYRDNFPSTPNVALPPQALDMLEHYVVNGEVVVPPGHYFAMGDNRDNSADSRYWGFVPSENIKGKPLLVYWSYEASTEDLTDFTIGHFVDLLQHFFTKTRWRRTFMLIRGYPIG